MTQDNIPYSCGFHYESKKKKKKGILKLCFACAPPKYKEKTVSFWGTANSFWLFKGWSKWMYAINSTLFFAVLAHA